MGRLLSVINREWRYMIYVFKVLHWLLMLREERVETERIVRIVRSLLPGTKWEAFGLREGC